MNKKELAKKLARTLLLKEGQGKLGSFRSFMCIQSYFNEMSVKELQGIATLYSITDFANPTSTSPINRPPSPNINMKPINKQQN